MSVIFESVSNFNLRLKMVTSKISKVCEFTRLQKVGVTLHYRHPINVVYGRRGFALGNDYARGGRMGGGGLSLGWERINVKKYSISLMGLVTCRQQIYCHPPPSTALKPVVHGANICCLPSSV